MLSGVNSKQPAATAAAAAAAAGLARRLPTHKSSREGAAPRDASRGAYNDVCVPALLSSTRAARCRSGPAPRHGPPEMEQVGRMERTIAAAVTSAAPQRSRLPLQTPANPTPKQIPPFQAYVRPAETHLAGGQWAHGGARGGTQQAAGADQVAFEVRGVQSQQLLDRPAKVGSGGWAVGSGRWETGCVVEQVSPEGKGAEPASLAEQCSTSATQESRVGSPQLHQGGIQQVQPASASESLGGLNPTAPTPFHCSWQHCAERGSSKLNPSLTAAAPGLHRARRGSRGPAPPPRVLAAAAGTRRAPHHSATCSALPGRGWRLRGGGRGRRRAEEQ